MFKTIHIELHAANPQLPLMPVEPFTGSAASFVICNVPRPIGNRTITGVSVNVTNVAGTQTSFSAVRNGSAWCATATAAAIGASGTVQNGVLIVASGKDDANNDASWIIGAGDLVVHATDGSVAPGTSRQTVYWFDTVPASPSKGAIAKVDGSVKIWDGTAWISMGGGGGSGDVKHADFADVAAIGDRYGIADLKGKVNEMLGILKGTATAVALMLSVTAFADFQTARLDELYNDSLVVTNVGDKVAWLNVTNAPDFASKAYADQYANQAPFYSTVSNMAVNSAQIVGQMRTVTVGECIISRQGSEHSSYNGSYFYDYNGSATYYLPWNELWATALPAYRLARIADIPTDYIPAAGSTNSVSAILAAARTDSASIAEAKAADTRAIVATWENFLDGSNVVFSITNYISGTYNLDNAKFRILEMTNGFYREVYNSREEITMHINNFKNNDFRVATNQVITSVNEKIAGKADKAWGRYTSAGGVAPSNTVYMTEPQTVFAGGLEYERVAVGEGAVCILTTKGAPVYTAGDEGTFKFQDDGGTNYFGFAKTDSYTIGCNTDGITVQNSIVTLTYNVTMSGVPCIWYKQDVGTAGPWEQLNLSDGTAVPGASHLVTWDMSPAAGTEVCYINCANQAKGFFKATVEVPGSAKFMTNMPADLGGGIICTNTATGVNGVIRPSFNGSTVIWSWSAQ